MYACKRKYDFVEGQAGPPGTGGGGGGEKFLRIPIEATNDEIGWQKYRMNDFLIIFLCCFGKRLDSIR